MVGAKTYTEAYNLLVDKKVDAILGDDCILAAQAGVSKSFPAKSIVIGSPAVPRKEFIKQLKLMKDAAELVAKFKKYEPLLKTFEENQEEVNA